MKLDAVEVRRCASGRRLQRGEPVDRREQERGLAAGGFEDLVVDGPDGPVGHVARQRLGGEEGAAGLAAAAAVSREADGRVTTAGILPYPWPGRCAPTRLEARLNYRSEHGRLLRPQAVEPKAEHLQEEAAVLRVGRVLGDCARRAGVLGSVARVGDGSAELPLASPR